jgi:hypothetical protein
MAEKEEEKGFVIKDRRRFAEGAETEQNEGAPQSEAASPAGEQKSARPEEAPDREEEKARGPLPEVTLATFIFSLSSSALGMLQEKTKGNLDQDEERLLKSVLYDLRMRYIQKSGK